jgi:hypothetical protein
MNKPNFITPEASLLAEAIAGGLHSLAQPLTATQWCLETAMMQNSVPEQHQTEMSRALNSLEGVVAQLNILRDMVRPFRMGTQYTSESFREALRSALDEQHEALEQEGVQVRFQEGCAEGIVLAPQGFVQHIAFCLFSTLRSLAPLSGTIGLSETEQSVLLLASMACTSGRNDHASVMRGCSTIRSYVEILRGDFSIAQNLSSLRISLPKWSSSI